MATGIDSLRDRFRATCADRIRDIRRAADAGLTPGSAAQRDVVAELHAIKGESAMVGFRIISRLAHALENLVLTSARQGSIPVQDVLAALQILFESLSLSSEQLLEGDGLSDLVTEVEAAYAAVGESGAMPAAQTAKAETPEALPVEPAGVPVDIEAPRARPVPIMRWTRVDTARIDSLCDAITESTMQVNRLRGQLTEALAMAPSGELARVLQVALQQCDEHHNQLDGVASGAWELRLVPVAPALEQLMEHARTLAIASGKQVDIEVVAGGVELERSLLEELQEPLMHIVRNAIDHGLERAERRGTKPPRGHLRCNAEAQGAHVRLTVEDDGAGMDIEFIRQRAVRLGHVEAERARRLSPTEVQDLIFLAGFTQRDVANEVSGRGVGLSSARRKVEGLGGSIRAESTLGKGSRFELLVPSTVAKERVLLIDAGEARYGFPSRWVLRVVRDPQAVGTARTTGVFRSEAGNLPVRSLNAWLGLDHGGESTLLVAQIGERRGAILVSRLAGEYDLLRRPADRLLGESGRVIASGTSDDGRVVLLLRWAEILREGGRKVESQPIRAARARAPLILIVDDSDVIRDIVADILSQAGFSVEQAANGAAALERLQSPGVDLVISDVEMPRMDGLELLQAIRSKTETLPIIMLTTRSSPDDRRKAASLGANAYLVKSEFQGATLLQVVQRFVELPR